MVTILKAINKFSGRAAKLQKEVVIHGWISHYDKEDFLLLLIFENMKYKQTASELSRESISVDC